MVKLTLYFLLACAIVHTGYSIKCYACLSTTANCKDPFNSDGILSRECDSCMKVEDKGGNIIRGCEVSAVCSASDAVSCETCDSDNCNGANKHSTGIIFLVLVPSLAVVLRSYVYV